MISVRRVIASALAVMSVIAAVGVAGPSPAVAERVGDKVRVSDHQGISPVVATDAHGNTTAFWLEQDRVDDNGPPDHTKWRARTGTLPYGTTTWTLGPLLSTTGAVYTHPHDGHGMSPRHAIAVAPSGSSVIAWVQTIAGEKRIQMAYSPGFAKPFNAPVTIPATTTCATLSDIQRLTIGLDDTGGALTDLETCLSGSGSRRAVHIGSGGSFSASHYIAATSRQASVLRTSGGTSTIATYEYSFIGMLTAYTLSANGVIGSRPIVKETTTGTNGIDVALSSTGDIVSALSLKVDGSMTIIVDVNSGNSADTPVDRTIFDPVPDDVPFSPAVAAGADGTMAVAWLEGQSVWVVTRHRSEPWSTPVTIGNPVDGGTVQDSVKVGVSPGGIAHVAWTTQVKSGGITQYVAHGAVRGARTATVPAPRWSDRYPVFYDGAYPDMTVLEDGWAVWTTTYMNVNDPSVEAALVDAPEDDVKPTMSGASVSRTRFSPGTTLNNVALKTGKRSVSGRTYTSDLKVGVSVRYTQSEWGTTLMEVRHVGCASTAFVGTPKEKLVRCKPDRLAGAVFSARFEARSGTRGQNVFSWNAQPGPGKKIAAGGKYVISLTPIDAAGNRGRAATFNVQIDGAARK